VPFNATKEEYMLASTRVARIRALTKAAIVLTLFAGMLGLTIDARAQATDPETIFNQFHVAVNAHDVDAALAFFADDAVVQFPNQPPPNVFRGKAEIRTWLQGDADQHIQVTTEQFNVSGDKLTWIAKVVTDDVRALGITIEGPAEAVLEGGKFKSFAFTLSDATLAKVLALGMLCGGGFLLLRFRKS
jgi:ketosteroid isomerase-like protein